MRRWKKVELFIVTIMLSIAYTLIAFLNWIGSFHSPVQTLEGPVTHPILDICYWWIALIISWTIYFVFKDRPGKRSFLLSIIVGIALIFAGVFLWFIAKKIEDTVIHPQQTTILATQVTEQ